MEDFYRLRKNAQNQSDNLQTESCKDWNFTGQAVKFFGLFTAAKQFTYICAEKRNTFFALKLEHSDVLAFIVYISNLSFR